MQPSAPAKEKKAPDSLASKLSRPGNITGVNKAIASNSYNKAPKSSKQQPRQLAKEAMGHK